MESLTKGGFVEACGSRSGPRSASLQVTDTLLREGVKEVERTVGGINDGTPSYITAVSIGGYATPSRDKRQPSCL